MARRYVRDAKGRFAGKGFSGQTGGRGARLTAKGKKRDGGGAIVKPTRIGEMKNTISKSSSKRKVNASSRASDRQIARDVAARSKPAARTSKATASARKSAKASGEVADRKAAARKENDAKKVASARTGSTMTSTRAAQVKAAFDKKKRNGQ